MSGKHKGKFERLERLTQDPDGFKQFWEDIDWRLSHVAEFVWRETQFLPFAFLSE